MNTKLIFGVIKTLRYPRSIEKSDLYSEGCLLYLESQKYSISEGYIWNSIRNGLIRYIKRQIKGQMTNLTLKQVEEIEQSENTNLGDYFGGKKLEILELTSQGYSQDEITEKLGINKRTMQRIKNDT